jgi:hypothetical protein
VQVLVDACLREHVVSARGLVGGGPSRDISHPSIIRIGTAVRDIETRRPLGRNWSSDDAGMVAAPLTAGPPGGWLFPHAAGRSPR